MRPTWHFVAHEDIRWMLALAAPRVNAVNALRYRQLKLDAATFRRQALDGQRMAYVLMRAELDALIGGGRYFTSRGPATVQDFAKWSGLAAARRIARFVGHELDLDLAVSLEGGD